MVKLVAVLLVAVEYCNFVRVTFHVNESGQIENDVEPRKSFFITHEKSLKMMFLGKSQLLYQ